MDLASLGEIAQLQAKRKSPAGNDTTKIENRSSHKKILSQMSLEKRHMKQNSSVIERSRAPEYVKFITAQNLD